MALIEPNTEIRFLLNVPLDPSYENTLYFDTIAQQTSYFLAKSVRTLTNYSYQRKNAGVMRVGWVADLFDQSSVISEMYMSNYMMFKNSNFENKWFYAFVTKIEYVNNNTVDVYYDLDVLQSWHFEYKFNQCLIERQHTTTDEIGENTVPENLEIGDYVMSQVNEFQYEPCAVVISAGDLNGDYAPGSVVPGLSSMGNWFSGVHFYPFPINNAQQIQALNDFLEDAYGDRDRLNSIIAVLVMPNSFIDPFSPRSVNINITTDGQYKLDGYITHNRKLMTYPYNMIYVSNYQGGHAEYKYEYFSNPQQATLKIWGNKSSNPGIIIYPNNYKVTGDNFDEMLSLSGFPMCAWVNDAFKAWFAQNSATLGAVALAGMWEGAKGIVNTVAGAYTGNTGMLGSGANQIQASNMSAMGLFARIVDHEVLPPTAHGNNNGNILFQAGKMTFMWCHKTIRYEYASMLDNYFDMFGYAVHRAGIPNRKARPYYTYVKTVGCSLDGSVPVEDLRKIESIFDKGVRFWTTAATFGVYDFGVNPNIAGGS